MSNNSSNSGCNIFIILAIIVSVIVYIVIDIKNNPDSYAETGSNLMVIVSVAIVYLIYRFISNIKENNKKKSSGDKNDGCLKPALYTIGGIGLFVTTLTLIGNNYKLNKDLGIAYTILIVSILIVIVISFLISNNKD